jgi:hypothetical protein
MGRVVDRSQEHLGPADRAIIAARKLLTEAVRSVKEGDVPRGSQGSYHGIGATEKIFPREWPWRDVLLPEMYPLGGAPVNAEAFTG